MSAEEIARIAKGLTEAQRTAFFTISQTDWHRRPFRSDRSGGRVRDFDRIAKCLHLELIEHRINMGAEYRLTPLGLAVRTYLKDHAHDQ